MNIHAYSRELENRADKNIQKHGLQNLNTLGLALAEETGEVCQAILQFHHENGTLKSLYQEAIDTGALCLQIMLLIDSEKERVSNEVMKKFDS